MPRRTVTKLPLANLRPHPRNAVIYGHEPVDDLIAEIEQHGMLEPVVVTPKHMILSGHRRVRAAKALGWSDVPVRIDLGGSTAARLVAFNRQRRKTWTQLYHEAMILLPLARRRAAARRRGVGRPPTPGGPPRRALADVATTLGLKRESLRRLIYIHDLERKSVLPGHVLGFLNSEKWTLHKAYLFARALAPSTKETPLDAAGRWRRFFDVWAFRHTELRLGGIAVPASSERRGAHAPQVFANLVNYFSPPGGLVADPMAGGGSVHDVCALLGRRCVSLDLSPRRPFIRLGDARVVPSDLASTRFDLIVLDPPYGSTLRYSRKRADLSNIKSAEQFVQSVAMCVLAWRRVLAPAGTLAIFMGNHDRNGECTDLAWQIGRTIEDYLEIIRRIWVPYVLTERTGIRAARAAKHNRLATRQCEVFICRHPSHEDRAAH